jgi:hypothetical protein
VLTVRFEGFWPEFRPADFFVPLLERALGETFAVRRSMSASVDVRIRSVFPSASRLLAERIARKGAKTLHRRAPELHGPARLNLWFTGENVRPPVGQYDLTLSFDTDTYEGTNAYLPLVLVRTEAFGRNRSSEGDRRLGLKVYLDELQEARNLESALRPRFACLILSNPEPTRLRMAQELGRIAQVDIFGPTVGRPIPTKAEVAHQYRFIICFENSFFPGYITEKVLDAWALGCVPLWAGLDRRRLLNPEAVVNLWDFSSMAAMVDRVAELETEPAALNRIVNSPLLKATDVLDEVEAAIRRVWETKAR